MRSMAERTSIGIGVIGFGWMGQAHSRSYRRIPTLFPERTYEPRLVVCADNVRGTLRRGDVVVRLRARPATTGDASSTTPTSTSCTVTAPNMLHEQLCVAAADAGKHLFCEKPVGGTPAQTVARSAPPRGGPGSSRASGTTTASCPS